LKGVIEMARCPMCGKDVETPVKEWVADKTHVSQYECCGKKFREYVEGLGAEAVSLHGSARLV
jgi:hypothetical protein